MREQRPFTHVDSATSYVLSLPARAEYVALVRLALAGLAHAKAIGEEELADAQLAATEAVTNAIIHAYPPDQTSDGQIRVSLDTTDDRIRITVEDEGIGIQRGTEGTGLLSAGDHGERRLGIGIEMIHALMDEVSIAPGPDGRGTRVQMIRYQRARERCRSDAAAAADGSGPA